MTSLVLNNRALLIYLKETYKIQNTRQSTPLKFVEKFLMG